jgi:hypothetical protein
MTTLRLAYGHRAPPAEEAPDLLDLWLSLFGGLDDGPLLAAVQAHIADGEAGRWWPTPADLIRRATPPPRDAHATFDAFLQRIAAGHYGLADLCTDTERRALDAIGGSWALRNADVEHQLPRLRRRFVEACATSPAKPAALRALPGGKDGGR